MPVSRQRDHRWNVGPAVERDFQSGLFVLFMKRFKLCDGLKILGPAGSPLHLNEAPQLKTAAGHTKKIEHDGMG
jgi:hypothetical protein